MKVHSVLLRVLILSCVGFFAVSLTACKDKKIDDDPNPIVDPKDDPVVQDLTAFYDDLILYEARLISLTESADTETYRTPASFAFLMDQEYDTYTRDELYALYASGSVDYVYGDYLENLFTARDFVTNVKNLIADDLDKEIGESFHPDPDNDDIVYRFLLSSEDYIVIDAAYGMEHTYVKIGMSNDLLEYYELHYSYSGEFDPLNDSEIYYNYFTFIENNEAVYINCLDGGRYDLRYTSIADGRQFTISSGELEDEEQLLGYTANIYNPLTNSNAYLSVAGNEIISETYDVFSDYGQLYRYTDHSQMSEDIILTMNVIEATGWDHLMIPTEPTGYPGELEGIYDSEGNALYTGRIRFSSGSNYAYAGIDVPVEHGTLSDDDFSLSAYGLHLAHPKATVAGFNAIQIHDFNGLKQAFMLDNLDFFAADIRGELYDYLDSDIKASIEGTNDPDQGDVLTGDAAVDLLAALTAFYQSEQTSASLVQLESGEMTYYLPDGSVARTEALGLVSMISSDDLYYRLNVMGSRGGTYTVTEYNEQFYSFDHRNISTEYHRLYDDATPQNFEHFLRQNSFIYNPLDGVKSVESSGENTYQIELNMGSLPSLYAYFGETMKLYGIENAIVTMTITIGSNSTSYSYTIDIGNFYYESSYALEEASYHGEGTISKDDVTILEPIQEGDSYYLPKNKDEILFDATYNVMNRYVAPEGTSYLRIYLEPGNHKVYSRTSWNAATIKIQDENGNVISEDSNFSTTEAGYYYVSVTVNRLQSIDINVEFRYVPVFSDTVLDIEGGTSEITTEQDIVNSLILPTLTNHTLLHIRMNKADMDIENDVIIDINIDPSQANSSEMCALIEVDILDCYFDLEPDIEYTTYLQTDFVGVIVFDYEFIDLSEPLQDTFTLTSLEDIPAVILADSQNHAQINFSITEEKTYNINLNLIGFDSFTYELQLFDSNGTVLDSDVWSFHGVLPVGDYYITYDIDFTHGNTVIIETVIQ